MSTVISEANWSINVLSGLGFLIAVYSYYVKWSYKRNPSGYRALCDLGENISCSRVITSKYGSGFGVVGRLFGEKSNLNVSNSILGALFYIVQIALTFHNEHESVRLLALATAVSAVLGCIYLAYILYFVLKDFCLVCNASYIINALILYYNWTLFYLPSEP